MQQVFLPNAEATEAWGRKWAAQLRPGHIVKITGPLGAGKTTLVRGVVEALGGNPHSVHSPTFSLVHQYATPTVLINHCDFYRLPENSELEDFGGLEFFESDSIFLIEWPERIRLWESINPKRLLEVDLQHDADGRRLKWKSMN
jgi:tRNA threonylcarbamoyl adenosine modification protein YjeE